MEIEIRDQLISIPGYHPIDTLVDEAFRVFYQSFFSNPDFSILLKDLLPSLSEKIEDYYKRTGDLQTEQKPIINNLTPVWKFLLDNRQLQFAQDFWKRIIEYVDSWAEKRGARIHKGAIFFYWGGTAIEQGDLDKGFFLMHSAYEEDVETTKQERPNTPAFKFVSLNFEAKHQLFRNYTVSLANYLDPYLKQYRQDRGTNYTREDFRRSFLEKTDNISLTFSFTYILARLYKIEFDKLHINKSEFGYQYKLSLIFNLSLVIGDAIKNKDPNQNDKYFLELVEYLLKKASLPLTANELKQYINQQANIDFDATILNLINSGYSLPNKRTLSRIESDIGLIYCIRNYAAHHVGASELIWNNFHQLLASTFNVLFLIAEELYNDG
jgi:hypothetical protein